MRRSPTLLLSALLAACATTDPLPSWNDGPAKSAIVDFVDRVTDASSADYVAPAERVATFDNDGTLWSEKPVYFQLLFAVDRIRELAPEHPEWRDDPTLRAAIEGDVDGILAGGEEGLLKIVYASHADTTTDEFRAIVGEWIETARHPGTQKPYTRMVYEPMLELLDYLRAEDFDVFIVSGGGIDFLRVWAEEVYGVPPQNVVGSALATRYEHGDGEPSIVRLPELSFIDDGDGKPLGIDRHIGRRPIAAFGNSDGDLEMLQWTAAGEGPRLMALVHHTDGVREWAYDRDSPVGRLRFALDEAIDRDWVVIDMAADWATVHPATAEPGDGAPAP